MRLFKDRALTRAVATPVAALALIGGATGASLLLTAGTASATACGTAIPAGSSCTATGTLNVTGGSLTLISPASLTWSATLNGTDQSVVDTVAGDQQLTVNDATGSGAGWHLTTSATTFTNGAHTLPDATTLVFTGSVTSISATTSPTATCVSTCTLPTNTATYPKAIPTAASSPTAVTTYDAAAATGVGQILIGGSANTDPVGWWVNVPSNAFSGAYTSTITQAVVSAP